MADIKVATEAIEPHVIVVTGELGLRTIIDVVSIAKPRNIPVVCNLAPMTLTRREIKQVPFSDFELLIVNESEGRALVNNEHATPRQILTGLSKLGARRIIVTLGDRGAVYFDHGELGGVGRFELGKYPVGAGDWFTAIAAHRIGMYPRTLEYIALHASYIAARAAQAREAVHLEHPRFLAGEVILRYGAEPYTKNPLLDVG